MSFQNISVGFIGVSWSFMEFQGVSGVFQEFSSWSQGVSEEFRGALLGSSGVSGCFWSISGALQGVSGGFMELKGGSEAFQRLSRWLRFWDRSSGVSEELIGAPGVLCAFLGF